MAKCFCVAQSQSQAVRILGILNNYDFNGLGKFDGAIVSTPRDLVKSKTCSYSVEFSAVFRQQVAVILKNNGFKNEIICT